MISIVRRYELEVAHQLRAGVPESHKCRRLHGHRYVLEIKVSGRLDDDGMLIEYADLDRVVMPIVRLVDHHDLNSLSERCSTPAAAAIAQNPTVERLVAWFVVRLALLASARQGQEFRLERVTIQEDSQSSAEWTAPSVPAGGGSP